MATAARQDEGIRVDLARRVDAIDRHCGRLGPSELANQLEFIRRCAMANGIHSATTVIHAIDAAISRGERGPLVHGWLAILRDAVTCDSKDPQASETFAAACSVRLGG